MINKRIIPLVILLLSLSRAFGQQDNFLRVYGTVTNENKLPLQKVTISLKGAGVSTVTNKEGKFLLLVPRVSKRVLIFSKGGYSSREVAIKIGNGNMEVELLRKSGSS